MAAPQLSLFTKTSQDCSLPPITPLDAFLEPWPARKYLLSHQGKDGRTQVAQLDQTEPWHIGSSMPNISEWPNAAAVCLLSQVLETGSIPLRYFLSNQACRGILRRAEKRGKVLPPLLEHSLRMVEDSTDQQETQMS